MISALRKERERAGIEQADLSAKLGKAANYVSRIETFERRIGIIDLIVIAQGLGIDAVELFARITADIRDANKSPTP